MKNYDFRHVYVLPIFFFQTLSLSGPWIERNFLTFLHPHTQQKSPTKIFIVSDWYNVYENSIDTYYKNILYYCPT